jgi:hypothetical protein
MVLPEVILHLLLLEALLVRRFLLPIWLIVPQHIRLVAQLLCQGQRQVALLAPSCLP